MPSDSMRHRHREESFGNETLQIVLPDPWDVTNAEAGEYPGLELGVAHSP
jgi:hypothetical protein